MSKEHLSPIEHDPYWTGDVGLFEGTFPQTRNEARIVRARIHRGDERYRLDAGDPEIVPIRKQTGIRTYLQMEADLPTRFPAATRITTPFDDPLFDTEEYRRFSARSATRRSPRRPTARPLATG